MQFTEEQYDQAIENLQLAKRAITDPGPGCHVCGGDCLPHRCGHNPLYAVWMCNQIVDSSHDLHEKLHFLAGFHTYMGEPVGPSGIIYLQDTPPQEQ